MKYSFFNDYSEGAHQNILSALLKNNLSQEAGYGEDSFSKEATMHIKKKLGNEQAAIHFISGGTQANLIVLAALLKPYESVIAPITGHIAVHEAGAIEATGHKINTVHTKHGKLTAEAIEVVVNHHTDEHMVKPKVVFLSHSTEVGTMYKKEELESIAKICKEKELYLYIDGARIGSALMSSESDLSLSEIGKLSDVFYIGGTKNGALLGEAIVITNQKLQSNFRYYLKQHGALLAKGRVIGIEFLELFKDNLYFDLAAHANKMASKLAAGLKEQGYGFLSESTTNQIFPILPNPAISDLEKMYGFYVWEKMDNNNSAIRLVTSWATKEEAVDMFLSDVRSLKK